MLNLAEGNAFRPERSFYLSRRMPNFPASTQGLAFFFFFPLSQND